MAKFRLTFDVELADDDHLTEHLMDADRKMADVTASGLSEALMDATMFSLNHVQRFPD